MEPTITILYQESGQYGNIYESTVKELERLMALSNMLDRFEEKK